MADDKTKDAKSYEITNNSPGPRFAFAQGEAVPIDVGATVTVKMTDDEASSARARGDELTVKAVRAAKEPAKDPAPASPPGSHAEPRQTDPAPNPAGTEGQGEGENGPAHPVRQLRHEGFGKWRLYDGDAAVGDTMSKAEAEKLAAEQQLEMLHKGA